MDIVLVLSEIEEIWTDDGIESWTLPDRFGCCLFTGGGGGLALVAVVIVSSLLVVDEEDEEDELSEGGSSSPAVSVVGRGVGEGDPAC